MFFKHRKTSLWYHRLLQDVNIEEHDVLSPHRDDLHADITDGIIMKIPKNTWTNNLLHIIYCICTYIHTYIDIYIHICMYIYICTCTCWAKTLGSYYFGISSSCALCWKECCNEHNNCETFQLVWFLNGLDPLDKQLTKCLNTFSIGLPVTYLPTYT